jgi:hypothetical protein
VWRWSLHNALVQNQTTSDSLQQLLEMPRKSWWARLPFGVRMTAGTSALLAVIAGGAAGVAALTTKDRPRTVTTVGEAAAPALPAGPAVATPAPGRSSATAELGPETAAERTAEQADRTATRGPRRPAVAAVPPAAPAAQPDRTTTPAAAPPSAPTSAVVTTKTEVVTREIPYETHVVRDPALPRGARRVQSVGVAGEETLRYLVTYTDGLPTDRRLLDSSVTRQPQHRVIAFGARRGPDRRPHCRDGIELCVPLGRGAACPGHRETEAGRETEASRQTEAVRETGAGHPSGTSHETEAVHETGSGRQNGTGRETEAGRETGIRQEAGTSRESGTARTTGDAREKESAAQIGGSVVVAGQDVELLDGDALDWSC